MSATDNRRLAATTCLQQQAPLCEPASHIPEPVETLRRTPSRLEGSGGKSPAAALRGDLSLSEYLGLFPSFLFTFLKMNPRPLLPTSDTENAQPL